MERRTLSGNVGLVPRRSALPDEELRDFVENGVEGLHQVGPDGTLLWANQAELDLLGYAWEEYVGRGIRDFHVDAHVIDFIMERLRSGQPIRNHSARLRHKDGGIRHVLISSSARRQDGRLLYTRCFTRDITAQVSAVNERNAVMDAKAETQRILDSITDGFLHFGPDWRITHASISAGREARVERPELVGKLLWEAFPQVEGTQFEAEYREAMVRRAPRTFEAYYAPSDTWLENRLYPAGDGLALYYRDITGKRRLERQLDQRSRQQRAVAALSLDAVKGVPAQDLFDRAMPLVADALAAPGCVLLELEGGGLRSRAGLGWQGQPPDLPASGGTPFALVLQQEAPVTFTDLAHDGRFAPVQALLDHGVASGICVAVKGRDAPFGVLAAFGPVGHPFLPDDVAFLQALANVLGNALERAAVERELAAHRDNLEQLVEQRTSQLTLANHELEAFSYTVSHDLRSPLRAIDGLSSILLKKYGAQLPEEGRQLLRGLSEGANRMGALIESVLALARVGRGQLNAVDVDLTAMAREVAEACAPGSQGIDVQAGMVVRGDAGMLRIALENLVSNAVKFTRNAPARQVRISLEKKGRQDVVCVADNGVGFDMADSAALFQPFHRLHSEQDFEGTGIGLATVNRIVQRHGGRVWATAEPGRGARLCFALPAGH